MGSSHFTDITCPWGGAGSKCRTYRFLPYFDFVADGASVFHKHMSCFIKISVLQSGNLVSNALNKCVSSLPSQVVVDNIMRQLTESGKAIPTMQVCILSVVRYVSVQFFISSPEPKARVSYCHSAPSVVCPSVRRRSSVNFLIFNFFSRTA